METTRNERKVLELQAQIADMSPNADWITTAHMLCTDAGIGPGHIKDRLEALHERIMKPLHASAKPGYKCADCTMDKEPCPVCYQAWWKTRHPNTTGNEIDAQSGLKTRRTYADGMFVAQVNIETLRDRHAGIARDALNQAISEIIALRSSYKQPRR